MKIKDPTPKSSLAEQEIEKLKEQFDDYEGQIKSLTLDNLNTAPLPDSMPLMETNQIAQSDLTTMPENYLKPNRSISCVMPFNEKFRSQWDFAKEYVQFMFDNTELSGETTSIWTKPFTGIPAQEWLVPCNKPIWGPRYLAEQVTRKNYHILEMQENKTIGSDFAGQYQGRIVAKRTIQRLKAEPVIQKKSIFMGATTF